MVGWSAWLGRVEFAICGVSNNFPPLIDLCAASLACPTFPEYLSLVLGTTENRQTAAACRAQTAANTHAPFPTAANRITDDEQDAWECQSRRKNHQDDINLVHGVIDLTKQNSA